MEFNQLDLTELDKNLSPAQRQEWNAIYASYRSASLLTGRVAGTDVSRITITDPDSGEPVQKEINCLVIIDYRVKILIPEQEVWYDEKTMRPSHVLRSMTGAKIDYVITHIVRIGECCIASRRQALRIRRRTFLRQTPEMGDRVSLDIIAVGRTRLLAHCGGFDLNLPQRDLSYAMIPDLRERYHTGETYQAVIKQYDAEKEQLLVSVKEAEPHPFDGADIRHPVRSRRASVITGKYGGGVFCRLEDNLDCLCTYSPSQYDEDFQIGDEVIVAISKFNYVKKQIYGKIVSKW